MKSSFRIPIIFLLMMLGLLVLTGCGPYLPNLSDGGLVVGQSFHLTSGETLNNDLTVIGGNARLDEGSTVNGDLAVIGGSVSIDGRINGDVSIMGGSTTLKENARVTGDISVVGGSINKSPGAVVEGRESNDGGRTGPVIPPTVMRTPPVNVSFDPIGAPLMAIFQGLAMAALAVLLTLFAPLQLERAGRAAVTQPAASGGVGCLTLLILVIMGITIILLPVSLIGFMAVMIAALFGWAALGLIVGRQLAVWLKQPWNDPVSAGVGTLAISLLASLLNLLWCIGGPIYIIVGLVVLGATVLTRFGMQTYPSGYGYGGSAPRPPYPYTPPAGPVIDESPSYPYGRPPEAPGSTPESWESTPPSGSASIFDLGEPYQPSSGKDPNE